MTNTKHNPFAPQGRILSTPGSHPGNDRGMHTALTQDAPLTEAPQLITLRRSRRAANAVRRAANAARRAPVRNLRKAAKKKAPAKPKTPRPNSSELLPWLSYEKVIVMFSGGKDSIASVVALLEAGCPAHLIELWHQDVDGRQGDRSYADWPVTRAYCEAFAKATGLPILFQWRVGGFRTEMFKSEALSADIEGEMPDGSVISLPFTGDPDTRLAFPQQGGPVTRWCSSSIKIEPANRVINHRWGRSTKFKGNLLVITGERREESPGRAVYPEIQKHATHTKTLKRVDHWRPVVAWTEEQVWAALQRWGVQAHPAYHVGWSRVSCMTCVFNEGQEWSALRAIFPERYEEVVADEGHFPMTIHRERDVAGQITKVEDDGVKPVSDGVPAATIAQALGHRFNAADILVDPQSWVLPKGAYKGGGGPV